MQVRSSCPILRQNDHIPFNVSHSLQMHQIANLTPSFALSILRNEAESYLVTWGVTAMRKSCVFWCWIRMFAVEEFVNGRRLRWQFHVDATDGRISVHGTRFHFGRNHLRRKGIGIVKIIDSGTGAFKSLHDMRRVCDETVSDARSLCT